LLEALNQANRRNFEYTLQSRSNDEIGLLFSAYNQLAKQLKTHFGERLPSALRKPSEGDQDKSPVSAQQSLRKAEITCLCARIPDIEKIIGGDAPDEVADYIHEFLTPFDATVQSFGGQIVKVLGDKIFAFYEGINSIDNAIRAAIKINQIWQGLNHERRVLDRDSLNYGIGLHSADGVAGSLSKTNWSYTFFGQASSIAAYLCLCAEREQILVSSSMMDRTSSAFQHKIVENLAPFGLSETEVFLEISSNLQSTEIPEKEHSGATSDLRTESSDMMIETMVGNEPPQKSGSHDELSAGLNRKAEDSTIPDMLEETLKATPLQSLNPEEMKDELPEESTLQDMKGGTFSGDKSRSLWDQVDQIPRGSKK